MKTLFWNCRGLGNRRTVRALKELCRQQDPTCLFLMETKRKDHEMNRIRGMTGLANIISVSCDGDGSRRAGGLALLWKNDVDISLLSMSNNHIDFIVTLSNDSLSWRATSVYGYPEHHRKRLTCELLETLAGLHPQPAWMVFGDFNLILSNDEKYGGNVPNIAVQDMFRESLQNCNLHDMGFEGSKYTWRNNQEGEELIMERLDRCLITPTWHDLFSHAKTFHIAHFASDHLPLLIDTCSRRKNRGAGGRILRFEECWLRDEECPEVLAELWNRGAVDPYDRANSCLVGLKRWAKSRFGNVPLEIKATKDRIQELQEHVHEDGVIATLKSLEDRLDDLLESEEIWWAQRSRAMWPQQGDKNSKFFHLKASQRKERNWVDSIQDDIGVTHDKEEEIATIMSSFFQNLFTSCEPIGAAETCEVVHNRVSEAMYGLLDDDYTYEEVYEALKQMKPTAAPGPDGLPALFYQKFWPVIGEDIAQLVLEVLNGGMSPERFNHTYLCLIPEVKSPKHTKDFRPISLCNVIFKLITKTVANRVKVVLPSIVGPFQSAFVPGRLITDNALIAFDSFHYMRKRITGKSGFVGLKLDMAKAYDRIEWGFLRTVLSSMGFPQRMTDLIMNCVCTASFSVLLNGRPGVSFTSSRGLRQGDPLSPYLFILCAEVLSGLLLQAQENQAIHGIRIAPQAPEVSHLFFADDSILFFRATEEEVEVVNQVLTVYQQISGQLLNLDKSEISYSRNVLEERKHAIQERLQVKAVEVQSKYLGLPVFVGRSKSQVFNFIQERVWKKLKGWKEKALSMAGREVLIKFVAQAIPTYIMSCFSLPVGLCNHIESMISRFWWGSKQGERKIHWVKWDSLCQPKRDGGMGFRSFKAFNDALLAKQGWRLSTCKDSLVYKCLKARYFPRSNYIDASVGTLASYTWRSIQQAAWVVRKGSFWRIGDGMTVRIWEDNWLPTQQGFKVWSPKPNGCITSHVYELINHATGTWESELIQQIFLPFEALQIQNIPLTSRGCEDTMVWAATPKGYFSVQSAYHCIRRWKHQEICSSSSEITDGVWQRLWNLKVVPRFSHFLWKVLKGIVPTRQRLWNKGVRCPLFCPRCDQVAESVEHALRDCPWSRRVWFASPLGFSWPADITLNFSEWCRSLLMDAPPEVGEIFATICYHIWRARNLLCFEEKVSSELSVVAQAMGTLRAYQETQQQMKQHMEGQSAKSQQKWTAPLCGLMKVNVDASGSGSSWGLAVVIRNHFGNVVAAATKSLQAGFGPEFAEACALKFGIEFALNHGFLAVAVESDCKLVVDAVVRNGTHGSYQDFILQDIADLICSFQNFSVVHVAEVITQPTPQVISPVAHSSKDKPVVIEDDDDDDEDDNVSLADKLKGRKRKTKPAASVSQKKAKGTGASTTSKVSTLVSDAQPEGDGKEGGGDAAIQADVHEHSISNPPSRENSPAPNLAKSKVEGVEKPPKAASLAKKTSTSVGRRKVRRKSGHKSPHRSKSSTNSSPSKGSTCQETQGATSPIREAEALPGKDANPMPPPKSTATSSGVANLQQIEESMGRLKAIVFDSGFLDRIRVDSQTSHAAKELLVFLLGQKLDSHQAAALANHQSFLMDALATFNQAKDVGQAVSLKEAKVSSGKAQVAAMKEDFKKFTARKVLVADEISDVDTKLEELHREIAKWEKKRADLVEEGPAVKAQLDALTKESKALIISTKEVIKDLEVDQAVKKDLDAKIATFADRLNSFKFLL
ncbi:uncharacterized protein LOC130735144 [Lotus japonicus]|uniref:uncharacterized protein LOC130735144 n=1 Tax=Lotus japonicus TaxID=34305 RepID=UPI00258858E3|nr:uncharacterized protein LOC130735144 [Lotus japonicus]